MGGVMIWKSRNWVFPRVFICLVMALWTTGCAQVDSAAQDDEVVIELTNVDSTAWMVTRADVTGIAELDVHNPVVTLTVGTRYRFVNRGTLAIHPLAIRGNDGEPVLGQRPNERPFERDPGVAFKADDEGVAFTLTEALAAVVRTYYCTAHPTPLMEGTLKVQLPTD